MGCDFSLIYVRHFCASHIEIQKPANDWRLSAASRAFEVGAASWRRINLTEVDCRDDPSYEDCKAVANEVNRMTWRALHRRVAAHLVRR